MLTLVTNVMFNFFFKVLGTMSFAWFIGFGIIAATKSEIHEQKFFAQVATNCLLASTLSATLAGATAKVRKGRRI